MALPVTEEAPATCCRQSVGEVVQERLELMRSSSRLSFSTDEGVTPPPRRIAWSTVYEQTTLGVGSFCKVHQVQIHSQLDGDDNHASTGFALKCLKPTVMTSSGEGRFLSAASDLVIEGELLSKLNHRNIIKLYGVSEGGPLKSFTENGRGYFLVTDLLSETLTNRLEKCRTQRRSRGGVLSSFRRQALDTMSSSSVTSRVKNIALGVASGLSYLHKNNVVHRDLKPDNIGFDWRGTPKIFDFGFARELHEVNKGEMAGTLRYIAPEVALGGGYETSCDVYSFGVLLWEICTLEKPFNKFKTSDVFTANVIHGNYRPSLSAVKCHVLRKLIQDCWEVDPTLRPPMSQVLKELVRICAAAPPRRHNSFPDRGVGRSFSASSKKQEMDFTSATAKCQPSQSFDGPFTAATEPRTQAGEGHDSSSNLTLYCDHNRIHHESSSSGKQQQHLCSSDNKKTVVVRVIKNVFKGRENRGRFRGSSSAARTA